MALPVALAPIIGGVILSLVAGVVFRVLLALGIGYATYTGVDSMLNRLRALVETHLSAIPPEVYQLAAYAQIGVCLQILLSAITIRFTLSGYRAAVGAITAWMILPKQD